MSYIPTMNAPMSKITSKSQTVIPKAVRERLGLRPGDLLRYKLEKNGVVIERVHDEAQDDPFATFTEWASEADERAYKSL
jgi:antitoxin PrlF